MNLMKEELFRKSVRQKIGILIDNMISGNDVLRSRTNIAFNVYYDMKRDCQNSLGGAPFIRVEDL